jgi:uncharacterized protein (TIGR03083 family)
MSTAAVTGTRALVANMLEMAKGFGPDDWAADSGCHGWRVQDVVAHMGFMFNFVADPNLQLPDGAPGTAEGLNDATVLQRADWTGAQVLDYYQQQSEAGLAMLDALQGEQFVNEKVELFELGSYPMAQLANATAFDHLTHLTGDLLSPYGPLPRFDVDVAAAIDPAVDWMVGGLPQMCGAAVYPVLRKPIGLRLTGPTNRGFRIERDPESEGAVKVTETDDVPADVATSDAAQFLRWATVRSAWRSAVSIAGDRASVAPVLDAVKIV